MFHLHFQIFRDLCSKLFKFSFYCILFLDSFLVKILCFSIFDIYQTLISNHFWYFQNDFQGYINCFTIEKYRSSRWKIKPIKEWISKIQLYRYSCFHFSFNIYHYSLLNYPLNSIYSVWSCDRNQNSIFKNVLYFDLVFTLNQMKNSCFQSITNSYHGMIFNYEQHMSLHFIISVNIFLEDHFHGGA